MIRTIAVAAILGLGVTAVLAQSDPITERRNAMKAVGAATRDGAAIAKGEAPFEAAKAQAIAKAYVDAAKKMPGLYPDNSKTGGETTAAPKIWEDQAGFKQALVTYDKVLDENTNDILKATRSRDWMAATGALSQLQVSCVSCHAQWKDKAQKWPAQLR